MKALLTLAFSIALAAAVSPALAHDPSKHQEQGATAPDCSSMKDMDMSKMDMNDPVMKAMHDKCMSHMHGGAHGEDAASHDHSGGQNSHGDGAAAPEHQHDKDGK